MCFYIQMLRYRCYGNDDDDVADNLEPSQQNIVLKDRSYPLNSLFFCFTTQYHLVCFSSKTINLSDNRYIFRSL